jgi:hypothetical protein
LNKWGGCEKRAHLFVLFGILLLLLSHFFLVELSRRIHTATKTASKIVR